MNSEKGQAFPLALIALAVGSLVISPFLGHASSMLTGSRIYGQAISEQYSCDAGIEWGLWKLKPTVETGEPLTTDEDYVSTPLEPFPNEEINSSSFPTTEILFVMEHEDITSDTPPGWFSESGWNEYYTLNMPGPGIVTLEFETEAPFVKVKLLGDGHPKEYNLKPPNYWPPYKLVRLIDPDEHDTILVQTPNYTAFVTMTVTITYDATIYDIRAQRGNTIITATVQVSCRGIGVRSWQVE